MILENRVEVPASVALYAAPLEQLTWRRLDSTIIFRRDRQRCLTLASNVKFEDPYYGRLRWARKP